MSIAPVDNAFYADPQGLAALKREAHAQAPESIRKTAAQFESLFTTMMLKSMRQATPKDDLFGSDQQEFYQDMFDQQLATQLSKGKGLGLADMLVQQLMRGAASEAEAAPQVTTPTARNWPPATREDFVQALLPAAKRAGEKLGVDPSSLIAHAALETGWGKNMPASVDGSCSFNLFGIKAGRSWNGAAVTAVTSEVENGKAIRTPAQFRAYNSPEACMQDYAELLSGSRYAGVLGTGSDSAAFAKALQHGGYATDPDYASKLTSVAKDLKLRLAAPIPGETA